MPLPSSARALLVVSLTLLVAIVRAEAAAGSSTVSAEAAAADTPADAPAGSATTPDEPVAPKPKKKKKKKAQKGAADASVVSAAATSDGLSATVDFNAKGVTPEEAERNRQKKRLYDKAPYGEVIPRKPADIAKRKAPKGTKPQLTNGEL